jgi:hypothetical protein
MGTVADKGDELRWSEAIPFYAKRLSEGLPLSIPVIIIRCLWQAEGSVRFTGLAAALGTYGGQMLGCCE